MKSDKWQEKVLTRESLLQDHLVHVLASCHLPPATPLIVALSGGADSMALALLLHQLGHPITTLTIDHGLRSESATEAEQVGTWMRARGIAHHILRPTPDAAIRNTQSRAREMRYRALIEWCKAHGTAALLVAHHADDQAETVALQHHRGDTPPSRAGMALVSMRDEVRLIRPLLGVRKAMLISYLQEQQQPWIDDPSNASDAYARNRLRHTLSDADVLRLWYEAQAQGEARHAEDVTRNAWIENHIKENEEGVRFSLSRWRLAADDWRLATDILSRLLQIIGNKPHRPRGHETEHLANRLRDEATGKATLGYCIIAWDRDIVSVHPEHYMQGATETRSKGLANPPFWWFNLPPFFKEAREP